MYGLLSGFLCRFGRSRRFRRGGGSGALCHVRTDDLAALTDGQTLLLGGYAARNRPIGEHNDGLLVVYDLNKRLAALHGQFLSIFIKEDHAVAKVLGLRAIAYPSTADVFAILEDFAHAFAVQTNNGAGRIVVGPRNVRAQDNHVGIGTGRAVIAVHIRRAVAVALIQACRGVILISGDIGRAGAFVADHEAVDVLAALKTLVGEEEGMGRRRELIIALELRQIQAHIVRSDVVAVV